MNQGYKPNRTKRNKKFTTKIEDKMKGIATVSGGQVAVVAYRDDGMCCLLQGYPSLLLVLQRYHGEHIDLPPPAATYLPELEAVMAAINLHAMDSPRVVDLIKDVGGFI